MSRDAAAGIGSTPPETPGLHHISVVSGDPHENREFYAGTPALFGCGDEDPHIPEERVHESAEAYRRRGADVTERIYEGVGHTVIEDEMGWLRSLFDDLLGDD